MPDTNLLELFTHDIGTAEQLLELIDSEFQALSDRDLPRLQSILADKLPLLTLLDQHGQAANLRNGRLIRSSQASATSMLGILRGNETPSLYDSRGSAARIGQQRPLSQA
jgi:flagella synthesis protein FlgN